MRRLSAILLCRITILTAPILAPAPLWSQEPASVAPDSVPQRDLMDVIARVFKGKPERGDTVEVAPNFGLSILPAFSVNPSVGVLFGVSGNAVTRLGPAPETNLSTISASVSYTTKGQFNVILRSNLFTRGNAWKFEGDYRYLDTNQPTYGLGSAQPEAAKADMDFKLLRFYETVFREATEGILLGMGYHLNDYFDIVDKDAAPGVTTPFQAYYGGRTVSQTMSSGVSFTMLRDTRDNPINALHGSYARASARAFPAWLGSDDDWQSLEGEVRLYPGVLPRGRSVLAFWGFAWLSFGRPPYLDLPAIGWDYNNRMGRGLAQGRIRANDLLYAEAEYRVTLSRNGLFGAVGFINLTSATDPLTDRFLSPDAAGGFGLRIKLNKHSRTNITLDYGFGPQGSGGLFLGTGEAF